MNEVNKEKITIREKEVLHYLSQGMTMQEVARELYISHHTVHSHKKNLLRKLDAKNSFQLGVKATRKGVI